MEEMEFTFQKIDREKLADALTFPGAYSEPALDSKTRLWLVKRAQEISYRKLSESTADGRVRQDMFISECRFGEGPIGQFASSARNYIHGLFSPGVFQYPLMLNEALVQRYSVGGGISPHIDGVTDIKYRNIIALFVLDGLGDLFICNNYEGESSIRIDTTPGNVILMRADGFRDFTSNPMHYLSNVRTERFVFALRQAYSLKSNPTGY